MNAHNEWACATPGCGNVICLTPEQESRLRQSHASFVCPLGHSQSFQDQTEAEKQIAQLERRLANTLSMLDRQTSRLASFRVCPWPGCRQYQYSDPATLHRHMEQTHGMPHVRNLEIAS